MNSITIKIYEGADSEGYIYDIFDTDEPEDGQDCIEGGQCTSPDIRDAIEMASDQAKELVVRFDNTKH